MKQTNKKNTYKRTITINKTTYANFYGVVNVFLGGDCVNSVLNVFGRGMFIEDGLPQALRILS